MRQHAAKTAMNKLLREGREEVRNEILRIIEKAEEQAEEVGLSVKSWPIQALARIKEVLDAQAMIEDSVPGQPVTGTPMEVPTIPELIKAPRPHRKLQVGNVVDGYTDLPERDHLRLLMPDIALYAEIRAYLDDKGSLEISFTHGELVVTPRYSNVVRVNGRGR